MAQEFDKYEKLGAYHYDWYDNPDYAWYKECVDRCVKFCKGYTADLGGGDGLVASKIESNGFGAVVFDNSEVALDIVENKTGYRYFTELNHPNFYEDEKGDTYDYACCLNVIEHLKTIDGIINFIRYSVNKGAIIITDVPTDNPGRYHEHEYTKEELLDTFKEFKPKYFRIDSTEFGKPISFHGVEIKK